MKDFISELEKSVQAGEITITRINVDGNITTFEIKFIGSPDEIIKLVQLAIEHKIQC